MQIIFNRSLQVLIFSLTLLVACQKEYVSPNPNSASVATTEDKIKDSTLAYSRDIYLWYTQIPASFNPRTFADPDAIMKGIRPYSIESGVVADRFSFAALKVDWDKVSSGVSGDFGISVFFLNSTDLRVKSVERTSPAGIAGIKRGWKITKINGSSNINSADQTSLNNIVNAVFYSTNTAFTFQKPDGSSIDITLNAASYQTHPVMVDSVYTVGGKKIGYMVFNSFLGDQTEISSELNRVFNRFTAFGVNDVVIDLRYNGGGYVALAEKLSNYLAPASATGSLMMKQQYNDKYSQYNVVTNYAKAGSLNLPRVIFIVSSSTASASELVINNLTPFMDVKLIGRSNTYGKPVGFFAIPVGDWYIFPVSFKTVNKNGESNYFSGFTPNAIVADGLDKDFGDVTEASLASAIKFITTGAYRLSSAPVYQEATEVTKGNNVLDLPEFKGTVSDRKFR